MWTGSQDPGFQKYASVTVNDDSRRVVTLAVNCQGLISIDCQVLVYI